MQEKIKVLIDTDIGDDIDDAIAIAYALNCPELDVLGITTVYLNAPARARMTKSLLRAAGRDDIPVHPGSSATIMEPAPKDFVPIQYFPDMDDMPVGPDNSGVQFLYDTICANPGEVVLLALGAFTNVALLLKEHPDVVPLLKEIVWMGGAFYYHFLTWNVCCDIESAAMVLSSGVPVRIVSRDVCLPCLMPISQIDEMRASAHPVHQELIRLIDAWWNKHDFYQKGDCPILFDSLAATAVFTDEFLTYRDERVLVETKGEFTRGMTFAVNCDGYNRFPGQKAYPAAGDVPVFKVADTVKADEYVKHHFERLIAWRDK